MTAKPVTSVNVICMKWGTAYGPDYVNILHSMVKRHLSIPFRFVCFTDNSEGITSEVECQPLPPIEVPPANDVSPWRKVAVFTPGLGGLSGKTLFLDLDVVVTGSLDDIVTYSDKIAIAENWTQPGRGVGNSSVFTFEIDRFSYIFETYNKDMGSLFDQYSNEQTFVSKTAGARGDLEYLPPAWVRSFKKDCMPGGLLNWVQTPRLPEDTRVVAFHGNPKPQDAARGHYPGKWYKHVKPTPWVAQYWK